MTRERTTASLRATLAGFAAMRFAMTAHRWAATSLCATLGMFIRIAAEHLVDETFGTDIFDFGQQRLLRGLRVEAVSDGVVYESHQSGRDNDTVIFVSDLGCSRCIAWNAHSETSF